MLVGFLLAIGAAFAYSGASLLQSVGARRAAQQTSALSALAGQPLYIAGLVLDAIGFAAVVVALQFLPLFVVQTTRRRPGPAITAIGAALLLGAHLPRAGWVALGAVLVGLAVIAASAQARQSVDLPTVWRWVLLGTSIPVVALGIWAYRRGRGGMVALAAGLAFSAVAIAARALEFPDPLWRILLDPLLWTLAVQGIAGTLLFARAAQTSNVTRISTVTFTTETVLPSVVGVLVPAGRGAPRLGASSRSPDSGFGGRWRGGAQPEGVAAGVAVGAAPPGSADADGRVVSAELDGPAACFGSSELDDSAVPSRSSAASPAPDAAGGTPPAGS